MVLRNEKAILLMAEDDDDDFNLAQEALEHAQVQNQLFRVKDGEELVSYLRGDDDYSNRSKFPLPNLIFLDLNMPRIDGKEAMSIISDNKIGEGIPILILTTSASEVDVADSYELGANSYIRKPISYNELVNLMKQVGRYWFETVDLPVLSERK